MTVKSLRKQLAAAIAMTLVATVALGSSTYAWFANNNTVEANNMSVIASADVEFLEIQVAGTNFTGNTIAVNATNAGSTALANGIKPVTPFTVATLEASASENTSRLAVSTDTTADGYKDGFIWTWTTASSGIASAKGATAPWVRAEFEDASHNPINYYLLNNFKFRTTVDGVTTTKLYASSVDVTGLNANALDEAVRVMIVGEDGIQIYDVGTGDWSYFGADGASVTKTAFAGLYDQLAYQADNAEGQSIKVFVYYEGDDTRLFTSNLNTMNGVTVGITFSVDESAY